MKQKDISMSKKVASLSKEAFRSSRTITSMLANIVYMLEDTANIDYLLAGAEIKACAAKQLVDQLKSEIEEIIELYVKAGISNCPARFHKK